MAGQKLELLGLVWQIPVEALPAVLMILGTGAAARGWRSLRNGGIASASVRVAWPGGSQDVIDERGNCILQAVSFGLDGVSWSI
jgi:hypothetical protein